MLMRLRRRKPAKETAQPTPEVIPKARVAPLWDDSPRASLQAAWKTLDGLSNVLCSDEAEAALKGFEKPLTRDSLREFVFTLLIVTEALAREEYGTDQPQTCL